MINSERPSASNILPLLIGGCIFFLLYTTLAMLFYNERLAFDASHYLVELINSKAPFVAHGRYIGVGSQLLPLIGIYTHASLSTVMALYSLGDVLYYFLLFLLILLYFKDSASSLALILITCLSIRFTFYCPVSELLQGLALLCLWNSMLSTYFPNKKIFTLFVLFLLITAHPLMFIPVGFVLLRYLLSKNTFSKNYLLIGFFVVLTVFKFATLDTYDHQKAFYPIVFNDYSAFSNLSDLRYIGTFFNMLFVEQTGVVILFLFTIILGLLQRSTLKVILAISSVLFYLLVIIATHRFTGLSNYSERMLLPFTGIVVLAFTDVFMSASMLTKRIGLLLCTALLLFRLEVIHLTARSYELRLEQLNELVVQAQTLGKSKVVVDEDRLEQVSFAYTGWCVPLETMLISSKYDKPTISLALQHEHIDKIKAVNFKLGKNQWIKWAEIILSDKELSPTYFQLKPENYDSLLTYKMGPSSNLHLEIDTLVRRSDDTDLCLKLKIISSSKTRISAGNLSVNITFTNTLLELSNSQSIRVNSDFTKYKTQLFETNFAELGKWNYVATLLNNADTISTSTGILNLDQKK